MNINLTKNCGLLFVDTFIGGFLKCEFFFFVKFTRRISVEETKRTINITFYYLSCPVAHVVKILLSHGKYTSINP